MFTPFGLCQILYVPAAGAALAGLEVDVLGAEARRDALMGLAAVLRGCLRLADKAVPTVLRLVEYLLK